MDQAVTEYIEQINQEWQVGVCESIRQIIHESIPEVEERLQYRKPHYLKDRKYACVLDTAKDAVSLTIFNARTLEAPDGLFEPGGSEDRKTIKIRKGQPVDHALLAKLIRQDATA